MSKRDGKGGNEGPSDPLGRVRDLTSAFERGDPLRNIRPLLKIIDMANPGGIRRATSFADRFDLVGMNRAVSQAVAAATGMQGAGAAIPNFAALKALGSQWDEMGGWKLPVAGRAFNELVGLAAMSDPSKMVRELVRSPDVVAAAGGFRELVRLASQYDPLGTMRRAAASGDVFRVSEALEEMASFAQRLGLPVEGGDRRERPSARRPVSPAVPGLDGVVRAYRALEREIELVDESKVRVNGAVFDRTELEATVRDIVNSAIGQKLDSVKDGLSQIQAGIEAQKQPLSEKVLIYLIIPFVIAIFVMVGTPIADVYIKRYLNDEARVTAEVLSARVPDHLWSAGLGDGARVVERSLTVRERPETKSRSLWLLGGGIQVLLIEKRRDWSLVGWTDEATGEDRQGWVFSRYLKRPE